MCSSCSQGVDNPVDEHDDTKSVGAIAYRVYVANSLSQRGSGPRGAVTLGDVRRLLANADDFDFPADSTVACIPTNRKAYTNELFALLVHSAKSAAPTSKEQS